MQSSMNPLHQSLWNACLIQNKTKNRFWGFITRGSDSGIWDGTQWSVFLADSHRRFGWLCSLATPSNGAFRSAFPSPPGWNASALCSLLCACFPTPIDLPGSSYLHSCLVLSVMEKFVWCALFVFFSLTCIRPGTYFISLFFRHSEL